MSGLLKSIDERTKLAGANQLEVLLFSLGTETDTGKEEVYGINVFKVREVMHVPDITRAPDMPDAIEGMISLRGNTIPIINLPQFCGLDTKEETTKLIVTEYNDHVQGLLVHSVDCIKRLDWSEVKAPPAMISRQKGGLVTAVSENPEDGLIMILDVEAILAKSACLYEDDQLYKDIKPVNTSISMLIADDSVVARSQITSTLTRMGIDYTVATNGKEAWNTLQEIADKAAKEGKTVSHYIQYILTDVEMPEMDGYVLTQNIKTDSRFNDIPVIMHSSLSAEQNKTLGKGVGADAYVSKFKPQELADAINAMISGGSIPEASSL
ncbi:MAG: chemotaxis protein [Gammaproteobacteria bacterium]